MKTTTKNSLVEFYFGTLEESARLRVEKDLLSDPEILLDYLDVKRSIESAEAIPQSPSPHLWNRLRPLNKRKRVYFSFAAGLVAACFAFFYIWSNYNNPTHSTLSENEILFDSGAEHSFASGVL